VRKTKIIATLGPSTASRERIGELVAAGMDVARLNFSHGTPEVHHQWAMWVREAADEQARAVAVLQDIQGPRIRVGTFPGGAVSLVPESKVMLRHGDGEGSSAEVFVQHLNAARLESGSRVLLADGLIVLDVVDGGGESVETVVRQGGELGDRKGAAFPGTRLDLPAVTEKDLTDLAFGAEIGVDIVAASFVTSGDDIATVREVVPSVPVIAKIERVDAYENLDDILAAADGAMVARGDLGVEMGYEPLPMVQKEIIARTNAAGRISITATEMLESMTTSTRPSRAEVTDVANAVLDGTDAVMLSAETAIGADPVRAVQAMAAICSRVEESPIYAAAPHPDFVTVEAGIASAIAQACADTANSLGLKLVVAFTESGNTALLVSKYRPRARIVAFTPDQRTRRRMALLWGVTPMAFPRLESTDEMIFAAERLLREHGFAGEGEWVVMAAGVPPNQRASTNLLKLHVVGTGSAGFPQGRDR
jgi:pyruvate kinase